MVTDRVIYHTVSRAPMMNCSQVSINASREYDGDTVDTLSKTYDADGNLLTADGKIALTGSYDETARLWPHCGAGPQAPLSHRSKDMV